MATLNDLRNRLMQNEEIKEAFESVEYNRSRNIFKRRMELGLSQRDLADKASVTQKTISRIEGGDPGIRQTTLIKVYTALDLKEDGTPREKEYVVHQ
ncbi:MULTISPECIES: helix-turn-helix domain-containing protein [unclassified Planococcus (in: firmicutes)]|uniref:helix-turn-helix domain-containing protein n=1 Tax=unclassified Planococcus (in: firmicutes) TaxID=2662419 RepID=UPI000C3487BC|nr:MULTISPECIES: helix-turn-helix domain-containing protein [unclassified Planococcus (in: firmicutes)]AUD12463.1 XRE family transcriptional regulator [Planococcus sp. MB-3u-03]PKG47112.1 XRE family transcriptional regulator [Planococcus sp. Urea-trap-24]PKG87692.1 XRE family transcriptional regulator [Planococcus sp. Urea-3u-39]PKG87759.1 XRE family transcriptional regulator [Planococcus sp. Urea-3u-39]PKH40427.1 XRE family transcriptional regulator [Planococcus sp. MB-3u-09]